MPPPRWFSEVRLKRYAPTTRMAEHVHDDATLCLLVAGGYEERTRGRADWHGPGQMMFCPAGEAHGQAFSTEGALKLLVTPCASTLDYLQDRLCLSEAPFVGSRRLLAISRQLARELVQPDQVASRLAVEGLMIEALGEFGRRRRAVRPDIPWVRQAREFVQSNACTGFTLDMLAASMGRHPIHVARSFRKAFGTSVGAFARDVRIARAASLLRTTRRPISDIAVDCGFFDQAHLTRTFKESHGITPAKFRSER